MEREVIREFVVSRKVMEASRGDENKKLEIKQKIEQFAHEVVELVNNYKRHNGCSCKNRKV